MFMESIASISSVVNEKSKISMFWNCLLGLSDLGIGIIPSSICHLNTICWIVLLYFFANPFKIKFF